jgi:hypothetical protein
MKYLKLFEDICWDEPFPEEEDLIDYLQEFFDKYSIKYLKDIHTDDYENDSNNYMIFHRNEASLSIDIYNDPNKEIYNHLLSIQPNIERRLGRKIVIQTSDYQSDGYLYNIIIYMRYVIQ